MRNYKSVYPELKSVLNSAKKTNVPIFVCNVETTGLDSEKDKIIQFSSIKCELKENQLVGVDAYNTFINPQIQISDFTRKFTGRDNDFFASQRSLKEVMPEIRDFLGNDPIVLSWVATDFMSPFLMNAGFLTGYMVYPTASIDLMKIVQSVLPITNPSMDYKFRSVADHYGIEIIDKNGGHDARHDVGAYIKIFNKIYPDMVVGSEMAVVNKASYWEKSNFTRAIYFQTDHGQVHLDANTYFFVEDTPGFFSTVDMDAFSKYILLKCKVSEMSDVVKLYYQHYKSTQKNAV